MWMLLQKHNTQEAAVRRSSARTLQMALSKMLLAHELHANWRSDGMRADGTL